MSEVAQLASVGPFVSVLLKQLADWVLKHLLSHPMAGVPGDFWAEVLTIVRQALESIVSAVLHHLVS